MAIVRQFNGKLYIEPVVDVAIKSGITNPTVSTYGRILIPDTGIGQGFAGGKASIPVTKTSALHIGTTDLTSGFNWSTTPQDFNINVNSIGVKNIPLTQNTTTLSDAVGYINSKIVAAGLSLSIVYAYKSGTHVGIQTVQGGTSQSFILTAGTTSALATLGWTTATYTGTSTTGTARMLQDFIYTFNDLKSAQTFLKGGALWDLIYWMYNPADNAAGANNVIYLKASEANQSIASFAFASGTRLSIKTLEEGTCGNGDITSIAGYLTKGYGLKLVAGTKDITKFKIQFYLGQYKGVDANGFLYYNQTLLAASVSPKLLFESNEFTNISDFITWATTSEIFSYYFEIDKNQSDTTGIVATGDLTTFAGFNVFAGGYETFSVDALSNLLSETKEYNYTFLFSTEYGDNGYSTNNIAIQNHIVNDRVGAKPLMSVGGHDTKDKRGIYLSNDSTTSVGIARKFNSPFVSVCHGGDYVPDVTVPSVLKPVTALYLNAKILGRRAGLKAMDSLVYKTIKSYKAQDIINNKEIDSAGNLGREDMIQLGVIHQLQVEGLGNVINSDINTLQSDQNLVYQTIDSNGNAISYENVSMQIKQELIRQTISYFKPKLIGQRSNQFPESTVLTLFGTFMSDRKLDGLITDFQKLQVSRTGTAYFLAGQYTEPTTIEQIFVTFSAII